jgi:hypothetical protein
MSYSNYSYIHRSIEPALPDCFGIPGTWYQPNLYNHLFRHTNESGKMVPKFPNDVEWSIVQWYTSCIDSDCRPRCPFPSGSVYPDDHITDRKPRYLSLL